MRTVHELESDVLRGVNAIVEPIIRTGLVSPFWPTGLIVVVLSS